MKLFDEIPMIKDHRIVLKPLTVRDIPYLMDMISDGEVYTYLPTFLIEQQYDDMHRLIHDLYNDCIKKKDSLILGVYTIEGNAFCGLAEFYGFNDKIHKTCIGYRFMRKYWGRGLASETVALMVDYLFNGTDMEIITASTMIENAASARVLEKNGFIRTAKAVPEDWGYQMPTIADKWLR